MINEIKKNRTSVIRQDVVKKALEKKREKKLSCVQEVAEIPQSSGESLQCKVLSMYLCAHTKEHAHGMHMHTHVYTHTCAHKLTHNTQMHIDRNTCTSLYTHILHSHTLELLLWSITIHRSTI